MQDSRGFPASPTTPREARHFVLDTLQDWGYGGAADLAALLVTELTTNAVLHARSELDVVVSTVEGGIRVAVADRSRVVPSPRRHSLDSATGRGLQLVADLSRSWGIDRRSDGKWIWFEVARHPVEPEPDLDGWLTADDAAAWR